jgi:predicted DCC family thiol-disulfide oxidoreductase YuxK
MLVLLYDGLCGFCDSSVQFVLARDPGGSMKFSPLQGEFAAGILKQRPELQSVDSLILVDTTSDGSAPRVRVRSAAVLGVAGYLGWPWKSLLVMQVVPRMVRDRGYDLFARHRYRVFRRYDSCPIPAADQQARFIP